MTALEPSVTVQSKLTVNEEVPVSGPAWIRTSGGIAPPGMRTVMPWLAWPSSPKTSNAESST